jgi:hypothetical protein
LTKRSLGLEICLFKCRGAEWTPKYLLIWTFISTGFALAGNALFCGLISEAHVLVRNIKLSEL